MPLTISGDTPNFSAATITTGTITTATITTGTVTTLNEPSGVLATQNGMTGIAKAWVNFNGTGTVAIRSSFNVSSITDNGTGDYTINFTTAMPNANYAALVTASAENGIGTIPVHTQKDITTNVSSSYRFKYAEASSYVTLSDSVNVYAAFFSS
jgi:hypothetical protein